MGLHVDSHTDKDASLCRARMSGPMTIQVAAELQRELANVLSEYDELELDLRSVERVDSAGLQILLALKCCEGKSVHLVNHAPCVIEQIELSNTSARLGDPLVLCDGDSGGSS